MLSKYLKPSKSVREIEDHYNELSKYSKSPSEVIIAERVKLKKKTKRQRKRKRQKAETETKILNPNTLFTRLPVLSAQIKARNNSYKLKNKIKQKTISFLLYQHNKITKKRYHNLIKSL